MVRLLALSLFLASIGSGCCHCYQRSYLGNGPLAAAIARPVQSAVCCSGGGCGEVYWGEWNGDPPDDFDPCCGDRWVGPRGSYCGGMPHTRLCFFGLFERLRGVRGDCLGYCCDGCGPEGCCDGSCGGGEMMSGGYESAVEGEYYSAPPTMQRAPPATQEWEQVPTPAVPGVMDPQSRGPLKSRSVNNKRYGRPPLRAVSHEEEVREEEEPASEVPQLMEEVLPDPRAGYRR